MDEFRGKNLKPAGSIEDVTEAARALCVLYHTSRMYRTEHAVFLSALEERLPVIERAMRGIKALTFDFSEGQFRYAGMTLEPGSAVLQRVARSFEEIGLVNLTFMAGVDRAEITRLFALLGEHAEELRREGPETVFQTRRFRFIHCRKPGKKRAETAFKKEAAFDGGSGKRAAAAPSSPGVWELSDVSGSAAQSAAGAGRADVPGTGEAENGSPPPVRRFVADALSVLARNEAGAEEVAEVISSEFEQRLEEQAAGIRRESAKRIRRLETVRVLIMTELERLDIAAVVLDTGCSVIAMNSLAEKLMGKIEKAPSILETFIGSGLEKQEIILGGQQRIAHLVTTSPSGSGSNIMLITLEKQ